MTLNPQDFRTSNIKESRILDQVSSGKAILFVGSGFSRGSININNNELPTANYLAEEIGKMGKFETHGDLKYAAEKFLRDKSPQDLIDFLKEKFTITKTLPHQQKIIKYPWKRIYTTNYDLCVEEAGKQCGKRFDTVEIDELPQAYLTKKNTCIHINGSINSLNTETINSTFKLSASSYLSAESFNESYWHLPFKRDLETCSAIVFVGYSLYDIDVQKILYQNRELAKKTYFIVAPNASERERFNLTPFGDCFAIGAEIFGELLEENISSLDTNDSTLETTSITRYRNEEEFQPVRDSDVDRFLMFGDLKDSILESALFTEQGAPLLIKRKDINYAIEAIFSGKNLAILSDFGNGKTVFLRTLKSLLSQQGIDVYTVDNLDEYNIEDLETIAKSNKRSILFVDSYDQHLDFIAHYADLAPPNINLVIATRSPNHDRISHKLRISFDEIFIDELNSSEIEKFVDIIDDVGFWDSKHTTLTKDAKISLIDTKHDAQIQQTLLSILQAPQMVERVNVLLNALFTKKTIKKTIFSINLLSALDYPLKLSLISEIAECDDIYSSELRENSSFKDLFNIHKGNVIAKSSLTSIALIRNNFAPIYVVDELLATITKLNNNRHDQQQNDLLLSLLRFSSVERLFPEKQRINNLARYYEELKRRVTWLKNDPHYWLQYAMALLAYDDFPKTQRMLDHAYEWAAKKPGYHTVHIDMQQCKLYLKLSSKIDSPDESFKLFNKGIEFINKVPNDTKKFRMIDQINNVFTSKYSFYNKKQKNDFISKIEKFKSEFLKYKKSDEYKSYYLRKSDYTESKMNRIIEESKEIA